MRSCYYLNTPFNEQGVKITALAVEPIFQNACVTFITFIYILIAWG